MRNTSCGVNTSSTSVVELAGRGEVVAERLLHHHPAPAAGLLVAAHPGAVHLLEHDGERGRRDGQVERRVALDAVRVAQIVQRAGELVEGRVVVERTRHELDVAGQAGPDLLPPRRTGVRLGRLLGHLARSRRRPSRGGRSRAPRTPAAAALGWRGRRSAGSSFLRARSPVTPKMTSAQGSGIRGRRRSSGSRRGFDAATGHAVLAPSKRFDRVERAAPTPASRSVRCSHSSGRPRPARACRSPAACAA